MIISEPASHLTNIFRDAYAMDCILMAILSLLVVCRPTILTKLAFVKVKAVPLWLLSACRFAALFCAFGAIVAILIRITQKYY
jgi:hypothetical protein